MENLKIENARIVYRNFAGKAGKFTPEGRRSFSVVLDEETALKLKEDGWNVKSRPSKFDDNEIFYTLPVFVNFDYYPPKIYMVANGKPTEMDEDNVRELDNAEITGVDLLIRPREWEVNGAHGVKAYVKVMYANIEVDDFAAKYNTYGTMDEELPF